MQLTAHGPMPQKGNDDKQFSIFLKGRPSQATAKAHPVDFSLPWTEYSMGSPPYYKTHQQLTNVYSHPLSPPPASLFYLSFYLSVCELFPPLISLITLINHTQSQSYHCLIRLQLIHFEKLLCFFGSGFRFQMLPAD